MKKYGVLATGVGETRKHHFTRVNKSLLIELPVPVVEGVEMGDEPSNPQLPEKDTEVCVVLNQEPSSSKLGSEANSTRRKDSHTQKCQLESCGLRNKKIKGHIKVYHFPAFLVMRSGHWP